MAQVQLPYLLADLHLDGFTGQLELCEGDTERTIYLHNGAPVQVQSRLQEETLGRILLDEGKLSIDQYNLVLRTILQTRKQAGELLVSLGLLGPGEVFAALEFQAHKKLANCFKMVEFDWEIIEAPVPPEMHIARLDIVDVLLSGIATSYTVDRLLTEFPVDEDTTFTIVADGHALRIGPKENKILRSLSNSPTLSTLMSQHELRYLLAVLYTFHALNILGAAGIQRPAPVRGKPGAAVARASVQKVDVEEEDFRPPTLDKVIPVDAGLAQKALCLAKGDPFEILEIKQSASTIEAQVAFQRLMRRFHLDSIDSHYVTSKDRDLARHLLERAKAAVALLSDEKRRGEAEKPRPPKPDASPRIQADMESQAGLEAMRVKRWDDAERHFSEALRLCPNEPSYHFSLGKLLYLRGLETTPPGQLLPDAVRLPLLKALALNPHYDEPRLYLGYLAKRNGALERALKEFQGALECNPQNRQAQSEIKMLKRKLKLD